MKDTLNKILAVIWSALISKYVKYTVWHTVWMAIAWILSDLLNNLASFGLTAPEKAVAGIVLSQLLLWATELSNKTSGDQPLPPAPVAPAQ